MNGNGPDGPGAEMAGVEQAGAEADAPRSPRAVEFSDAEWLEIEAAAAAAGAVSPDAFVRDSALTAAGPGAGVPAALGLLARVYVGTHLLTSLKQEEMVLDGRREEFERMLQSARATLAAIVDGNAR